MSLQHQRDTEPGGLVYPVQSAVAETLASITAFQDLVRSSLNDPHDFTKLPGTDRFTLLKPGAEKIVKLVACADLYEIVEQITDWDRPLFAYTVKCRLVSMRDQSVVWSEGLGECNTHEPKYRYRYAKRACPLCQYEPVMKSKQQPEWFCWQNRGGCGATWALDDPVIVDQALGQVPNPDPAELRNTMLKMAKKRSLVDAALSVASLSDLFTQDLDDHVGDGEPAAAPAKARSNGSARPPSRAAAQQAPTDAGKIKNAGEFMEYVNGRWPGHPQHDVLAALGTKKMSDLTWTAAKVSGYVKALVGFWGPGGTGQDDEVAPLEDRDPDADPTRDSEEAADVSATAGDGVEAKVTA